MKGAKKMQTCIDAILLAVPTVGAKSTYEAIYDSIDPMSRSQLPNALKSLKNAGTIAKYIDIVDGLNVHTIERLAL